VADASHPPSWAEQFFLHQKLRFICIRRPVFSALEFRHLLHCPPRHGRQQRLWPTVPDIADAELHACLGAAGAVLFEALERLMVLENQPAWRPHLRSKAALRQAPRRHYCDPSLAVAALGGSPDRLLKDLEWLGLLFESLVIRDLRVLAQALDGELFHYRDDYGVEVDAIVQLRDGRWGAIEIKLGPGQVEAAAAGLLRFRQQIDTRRSGEPAFLAVVCGSGYGYRRADGIAVVPVGALGA
jgi:predicted AAA+ superfamily ATPase